MRDCAGMQPAEQVKLWPDRKLRRYVRIAGRLWPDHPLVMVAVAEKERRARLAAEVSEQVREQSRCG